MRPCSPRLAACVVAGVLLPAAGHAQDAAPSLSPDEWATAVTAPCRAAEARTREADASLAARLPGTALSREQLGFLEREIKARDGAAGRHRTAVLSRFDTLLIAHAARFPEDTGPGATGGETFAALARALFANAAPCALEAIEATLLLTAFGLPLDAGTTSSLRPERVFEALDTRLHDALRQGRSAGDVFLAARPAFPDQDDPMVAAVARAAAADGADRERRLAQFLGLARLAAEPIRIQTYLHARVDEIEGALGTTVPDGAAGRLIALAGQRMFRDVAAMRRLQRTPPPLILRELEPLVDEWFRRTALPAVRGALDADPFAAFWFFVQSGTTTAPGRVFDDGQTAVRGSPLALSALERLPMREALARAREARIPVAWAERFAALEQALSEAVPREEVVALVDARPEPPEARAALRAFLLPDPAQDSTSALDIYSRALRDASVIRGRLDRPRVDAALDVLARAKAGRLERLVERALADDPARNPRLGDYLRTTGGLLIELERRQALERRFQQRTGGWLVGWILGQFLIAGGVPVALWPPDGIDGAAFGALLDELTPKNGTSGNDYRGKPVEDLRLVHDGQEYHAAMVRIIDTARDFLNVSSFDWKVDAGGRDIAYRLMAKKLGIDGARYQRFLDTFGRGVPLRPAAPTRSSPDAPIPPSPNSPIPLYDLPTTRIKDLLVPFAFVESDHPEVAAARAAARAAGASLACEAVDTCGDLTGLVRAAGERYDPANAAPEHARAWEAFGAIEALFAERPPAPGALRARRALRDYSEEPEALRRFVRRVGLRRSDRPEEPFPVNVLGDSKQNLFNIRVGQRSGMFPHVVSDPMRDIYFVLLEFDVRVLLWKGPLEFPWRVGPVPIPGRKMLGRVPMPFVPYPWLAAVPGFGALGPVSAVFMQYLIAVDPRTFWAMVSHTKSWSSEALALESGMGMGSKYINEHDTHKTWHDMGVLAGGPIVGDVNDHFVQVFNEARVNNTGLPAARGVRVPALRYEDYRAATTAAPAAGPRDRAWLLTTHPEQGDSNYRGVFMAALAAARRNIYIENSFFSDPLVARMLLRKAREFRGRVSCDGLANHVCAERRREAVQIHLLLPDSSDKPVVDAVGTADFHEMIHLGIKVHRWSPASGWSASRMLHTKAWLIDYDEAGGGIAYVGAANATQRSHLSDNEAGIASTAPAFTREVYQRLFRPDIEAASHREVDLNFHVVRSSNPAVRASRWLRRVLVDLLWFI